MSSACDFNQKLLRKLDDCIRPKSEHVTFLMDTIHVGREAAYRRLRNEVPFTFNEAIRIAGKLNISLDEIMSDTTPHAKPYFYLCPDLYGFNNYYKCYYNEIDNKYGAMLEELMEEPAVQILSAFETITHTALFAYKGLSRFKAFKWHYQLHSNIPYSSVMLPDDVFEKHKEKAEKINYYPDTTHILGRNAFNRIVGEIKYFQNLLLITDEEVAQLKEELMQVIEGFETRALTGKTPMGKNFNLYLSNVAFDFDCSYVKGEKTEQIFILIYQMNTLTSVDPAMCDMQRRWIESLKKYSTLITLSGEMERVHFFAKQREIVSSL